MYNVGKERNCNEVTDPRTIVHPVQLLWIDHTTCKRSS